jgi:hypothetical protein
LAVVAVAAMSEKRKHVSYPDELNNPIVRNHRPVARLLECNASDEEVAELKRLEEERISQITWKRLNLLLDHYNIDTNSPRKWFALSLWLAQDHVRGMQVVEEPVKKKGAPRKTKEYAELFLTINSILAKKKIKISEAIRVMMKGDPERWGKGKERERALQVRYSEFKRARNRGNALNKISHKK